MLQGLEHTAQFQEVVICLEHWHLPSLCLRDVGWNILVGTKGRDHL